MPEIVKTADGSDTIYVPEIDEHYHSVHGAIQESLHIFVGQGYQYLTCSPLRILEIGFGTGLNAFMTAIRAKAENRLVEYTGYEKYPVNTEFAEMLNYKAFEGTRYSDLFSRLHTAGWNTKSVINDCFTLNKLNEDITICPITGIFDLVYFDAFGPDKQPEMWSQEIFDKVAGVTRPGGILVTYSAKGEVKRKLKTSGFEVNLLPGPPGKRQIIRAEKK